MRILSGIQPSGRLHLGNYFGMMKRMIDYQTHHELFCFIVNLHALTTVFDAKSLRENSYAAVADFLALGMDPDKSIFWLQSDVPEVTELTWYLGNVTPMGLLERGTSYKEKIDKGIPSSHGLFSYPVLMAADILLYQAEKVPVGKDQKQHLEMARDIAIKFNNTYGETFVIPEPEIEQESAIVPGVDGQKMSKSYGNAIEIFSAPSELKKRIMAIKTDCKTLEDAKDPETVIMFQLYKLLADEASTGEMERKLKAGGYGYGDCKKELLKLVTETFSPLKEKRDRYLADKGFLQEVLKKGASKARAVALLTLEKVRERVGVKL